MRAQCLVWLPLLLAACDSNAPLSLEHPFVGEIGVDESLTFSLDVGSAPLVQLRLTQYEADLAVTVTDEGGLELRSADAFAIVPEVVTLDHSTGGELTVVVRRVDSIESRGRFRIDVVVSATRADGAREQAERESTLVKQLLDARSGDNREQARTASHDALKSWKLVADDDGILESTIKAGDAQYALAQFDTAVELYTTALFLSRRLGQARAEGTLMNNLGTSHWRLGRIHRARQFLSDADALWTRQERDYERAATLSNLGILLRQTGEWQDAMDRYEEALRLIRKLDDSRGEAFILNNLGMVYSSLGMHERAVASLSDAESLFRGAGDRLALGRALANIGQIHLERDEPERALSKLSEAEPILRDSANSVALADVLHDLGRTQLRLGSPGTSVALLEESLGLYSEANAARGRGRALRSIGRAKAAASDVEGALRALDDAISIQREANAHVELSETLLESARLLARRSELDTARRRLEDALRIVESTRTQVLAPRFRQTYFATKLPIYELLIDVLMRLNQNDPNQGHASAAFEVSERAKARTWVDRLGGAGRTIGYSNDPVRRDRATELLREIRYQARLLERARRGSESERLARGQVDALLAEYATEAERRRADGLREDDILDPALITLDGIQRNLLDEDTVLLQIALGEPRSYAWVVSATEVSTFELAGRSAVEEASALVMASLRPRSPDTGSGAFEELSSILSAPLAEIGDAHRVAVVSDGILQYIPFAALAKPGSDGSRLMGLEHELVHLPSASTLAAMRREYGSRRPPARLLAVLADPVFGPDDPRVTGIGGRPSEHQSTEEPQDDYARLPFTAIEARSLAELVEEDELLEAVGFAASRETLESRDVADYRFLHIATHALVDDQNPELSSIVLSRVDASGRRVDGVLRLLEVFELSLSADLVVLSACETGRGRNVRGDGVVSLARGFMYAGAPRVLVSLWRVDDEATAELMTYFYRAMLGPDDMDAPAALLHARRTMYEQARWRSPYYWAGFVLQGEWR